MDKVFKLVDFNVYNSKSNNDGSESEDGHPTYKDDNIFLIQIFGLNSIGETCSIIVNDYKPFFYVMVNDEWNTSIKNMFLMDIKKKNGKILRRFNHRMYYCKKKKVIWI